MKANAYWYRHCPTCGGEGELYFGRFLSSGRSVIKCAECLMEWDRPEDVENGPWRDNTGVVQPMSRDEIEKAGWGQIKAELLEFEDTEFGIDETRSDLYKSED